MNSAPLTITNLKKSYNSSTLVLNEVSFSAKKGEFIVLVGPSGCGKSTLLRSIAGLENIDSGNINIGDDRVDHKLPRDRDIAMVFQDYALYPHKTVYENIAFSLRLKKLPENIIDEKVQNAALTLDLEDLLTRKPAELSGGQRQRVAIGRAIVRDPKVFLFDEPLSNLDAKLRGVMRVLIGKLHNKLQATVVYVTHDQVEAMTLADKIIVLNAGHVQQMGTPMELYYHPANTFVAQFLGSPVMNLVEGVIKEKGGGYFFSSNKSSLDVELPSFFNERINNHVTTGQKLVWGTRSDNFKLIQSSEGAHISGEVIVTEPLGSVTHLHVDLGGEEIQVSVPEPHRPVPGEKVYLQFKSKHLYLFDEKTGEAIEGY